MKTVYKTFEQRVKAGLKGEAKLADIEDDILTADILPLQNSKGQIDTKSPGFKALSKRAYAVASAWFTGEARVIDGKVVSPDELKVAISKTGMAHFARDGALSGIRVKAFRWTGKLVKAHEAKMAALAASEKGESKAPSGKVAVALKRSKAAKGKGKAPAAKVEAVLSVPQLTEQLRDALMKLAAQSRIVHATAIRNMADNIVREARTAIDAKPRIAKSDKVRKVTRPVADAPVAIQ